MMYFTHRPAAPQMGPPRFVGARTTRKIAMCGSHSSSLADAPWHDPSWEFWGHASSRAWYRRTVDRYFDLHPKACWTMGGKKGDGYPKWLANNTTPIYMQKRWPDVPAAIEYPKGRVLTEFGDARPYFTNHLAWMIALAMTEGVTTIGLYGINYSSEGEYQRQRGSAEYWLGRAAQAGIRVVLPSQCTLLADPVALYGYESHDETTGRLKPEYQPKSWKASIVPLSVRANGLAEPDAATKALIAAEEKEYPRPEWALGPMTNRTDGDSRLGA